MKKILIALLLIVSITLVACGKSTTPDTQTGMTGGALSSPLDLLVGTFKLEDTANAVNAEQAAELLPLWQAYETLAQSDTTAQEELDALAQQIKDTMTATQTEAITALNLTGQDMFALMQEQGITTGFGGPNNASFTPVAGQVPQDFVPGQGNPPFGSDGMPPSGGPGGEMLGGPGGFVQVQGGGDGSGSGTTLNPEMQATMEAGRTQRAGNMNRVSPALIEALITLLKSK